MTIISTLWAESLRKNGVTIMVSKKSRMRYLDAIKSDRMIYLSLELRAINITKIIKSMLTVMLKRAEVEWLRLRPYRTSFQKNVTSYKWNANGKSGKCPITGKFDTWNAE